MNLKDALDTVQEYFRSLTYIPPAELLHFVSHVSLKKIEKDEFLYKQNEHFGEIGFVVKGLLYNFYTKADGSINVNYFIHEGMPVTCYANLLTQTPASFSCKAIEKSYILVIQYKDFKNLYTRHSCWERLGRLSAESLYIEKESREAEFFLGGEERYVHFLNKYSKLNNRVPQYLIASYIGITPESLSRIRKKIIK